MLSLYIDLRILHIIISWGVVAFDKAVLSVCVWVPAQRLQYKCMHASGFYIATFSRVDLPTKLFFSSNGLTVKAVLSLQNCKVCI